MDPRLIAGFVIGLFIWASRTSIQFVLFGHLFVIPVLVLVATLLALALLALIAFIVREMLTGGMVLGRSA